MTKDQAAACVQRGDGAIFLGIVSLSLNNLVFAALPADIQPIISTFSTFFDVCSTKKSMPPPAVGVQHFLQTEGPPITSKFRRLDSDKLRSATSPLERLTRCYHHRSSMQPSPSSTH